MDKNLDKKPYSQPKLAVYGEVRNLTGGSATMAMDGTAMMVRNNNP